MSKIERYSLTEVCQLQGGSQPPKNQWNEFKLDNYVRMLQIRDFTKGSSKYIQFVKDEKKLKKCKEKDILIARYGASVGKILTGLEGAYNVALMKITPNEKLNREYLFHYLKSNIFQDALSSISNRSAQAGFNKDDLEKIEIPLPTLTKQKEIASILDKSQELISLRKESIKKLEELSKSIFIDMFGDPVSNPKEFEIEKLDKLGIWKGGGTPARKEKNFFTGNIPWITTVSLGKLYIDKNDAVEYITEKAILKSSTKLIKKNSLIIGVRVGVGKVSINKDDLCTSQDIMSLTSIKNNTNIIYAYYFIVKYLKISNEEQRYKV